MIEQHGTAGLAVVFVVTFFSNAPLSLAQAPHVLADGKLPNDVRLHRLKDLSGYFPFEPAASQQAWKVRAAALRRWMLVACGLWPLPTKTPLHAVVYGRRDRGDYTVEKAYFESMPGFYVTGNLYRPVGAKGKRPGVLCPHGHWSKGRFYDAGDKRAAEQIAKGAEQMDEAAHSPLQARCVQLARMGCVVFHYDMIGYADSGQIPMAIAHRFAKQRPAMNAKDSWGLFSPQAESRLQSVMGLQTYDSIRALDFLESLDDVDPDRLAVTGASGGGTQTFMISALDPRVAVSMPCVMVSTAMQGGCTCENCCLLRIGHGNVEFAALMAPKPLGLTAADDWTKEMATKGFPELKRHYALLGAEDHVMLNSRTEFKHNYNRVNRSAMYKWFNKFLQLHADVKERDFKRLTTQEMTVWDSAHPRPTGGDAFERKLLRWWNDDTNRQLAALIPSDRKSLRKYREVVGGAVDAIIGRRLPNPNKLDYKQSIQEDVDNYTMTAGLLKNGQYGEELPVLFLDPKEWNGQVVIWIDAKGKAGLDNDDGTMQAEVARLVGAGVAVVGADLLYQGEFLGGGKPVKTTRRVANTRESAAYTFGYNDSLFARRVHDILTLVSYVRNHEPQPTAVHLLGLRGAGPWVAAARAQAGNAVDRAAVDTGGFRFADVKDIRSPDFLPGGAKYLDLPGMLSLSAPWPLWLAGEDGATVARLHEVYRAAGAEAKLTNGSGPAKQAAHAAVGWLIAGK